MGYTIRISNELHKRLEAHASGFDTPAKVIERMLDAFEGITSSSQTDNESQFNQVIEPATRMDIIYLPNNSEEDFKQRLLDSKMAYIKIYYTNNTTEVKSWNAHRFTSSSSVAANLRGGYLRNWREKGIYKAEISVNRDEIA